MHDSRGGPSSPSQAEGNLPTGRPARRARLGSWRLKLAVAVGSTLLALVALESALRLVGVRPRTATVLSTYFAYDRQSGWTGRPTAAGRFVTTEFDVFVSHDLGGWRRDPQSSETPSAASEAVPVTWCLGDSGTWGWGVDDGETYVDQLNRIAAGRETFRNLGICGYSTVQEMLLLERLLSEGYRPDRVLALFCTNDLGENVDARDQHPPRPYLAESGGRLSLENHPVRPSRGWNLTSWLKTNSRLFNRLHFALARTKLRLGAWRRGERPSDAPPGSAGQPLPHTEMTDPLPPLERAAIAECYRRMDAACRKAGIEFRVVLEAKPGGQISELCSELGVGVIDIGPGWQAAHLAAGEDQATSFPHDPHYNRLGHELLARSLWGEMAQVPVAGRNPPRGTLR